MTLDDGRRLEVLTAGNPGGYPWLWIPGTPSAAVDYPRLDDLATKLDLRLVTWSRPGYGGSTPRPFPPDGPRIIDDIPDIEAILDALGIDEFVVVGWSGGGPRALACAAMLPDRCRASATLAGVAPVDATGLDWMAGMGPENVADFTAALQGPDAYAAFQEEFFMPLTSASVADVRAGFGQLLTPTDVAAFTGDVAQWLTQMMHRAGTQGVVGRARRRAGHRGAVGVRRRRHLRADGHLGRRPGRDGAVRARQVAGRERAGCRPPPSRRCGAHHPAHRPRGRAPRTPRPRQGDSVAGKVSRPGQDNPAGSSVVAEIPAVARTGRLLPWAVDPWKHWSSDGR